MNHDNQEQLITPKECKTKAADDLILIFIHFSPTLPWFQLVGIALVNALGYVIFRASETQRCEFAKDPESPALARK